MPAVALVLGNPVPHGALGEACVGLLLACGSVGDLGPTDVLYCIYTYICICNVEC